MAENLISTPSNYTTIAAANMGKKRQNIVAQFKIK